MISQSNFVYLALDVNCLIGKCGEMRRDNDGPEVRANANQIRALRKQRRITLQQLGECVGLSAGYISRLETGKRNVAVRHLRKMAGAFGVPVASLVDEADEHLVSGLEPDIAPLAAVAPPHGIPEFEIFAGASYGGGIDDSEWNSPDAESAVAAHRPVATWGLPLSFVEAELGLRIGHTDIIKIRGDSMDDGTARALASGDRVIIDRRDVDPRQGGIFAVWDGEGVVVKQVEIVRGSSPPQIICKSLNAGYDPFTLTIGEGQAHIIGRVAGKITRM